MIVASKSRELGERVAAILRNPHDHVGGGDARGVYLVDLLEALTTVPGWSWLSRDALVEYVGTSGRFRLDGGYVRLLDADGGRSRFDPARAPIVSTVPSPLYLADPDIGHDGYGHGAVIEIYPSALWLEQLAARRAAIASHQGLVHLTLDAALLVSWALGGNLERAGVSTVVLTDSQTPIWRHPLSDGALLVAQIDVTNLRAVPYGDLEERFSATREFVWTSEALFLDDPSSQALAVKKLFKALPQEKAEAVLTPHLSDGDPRVRTNVLSALAFPAYSVGFAPGAPLPPRNERLEHVALQPATVMAIAELASRENEQDVLDAVVCTMSAQVFAGSLRPIAEEVRRALIGVVPRLQSEQSERDARRTIRDIRHLDRQN